MAMALKDEKKIKSCPENKKEEKSRK